MRPRLRTPAPSLPPELRPEQPARRDPQGRPASAAPQEWAAPTGLVAPAPAPAPARTTAPRPFAQLSAPLLAPTPPRLTDFAPAPARKAARRRGPKALLATLAVFGLLTVFALPAFAGAALAEPPVGGVSDSDVQQLQVGDDVSAQGVSMDSMTGASSAEDGASWMRPVDGHLGDPFGPRPEQPVPGVSLFHRGQDIVAPCGTPIRAAAAGTVTSATWWGTYGNWILIDTGHGVAVGYAHESRMSVAVGQQVREGQVIGLVGETGAATGCHLHLEVHVNSVAINPVPFFAAKHISLAG